MGKVSIAVAGVFAFLGLAVNPAAALSYVYVITAPPNWALGDPQPAATGFCSAIRVGACSLPSVGTGIENDVTIKLLGNPLTYYAYTTPRGAANGVIGSDASVPTAWWLFPRTYWWTDAGPFGGGELAYFNSIVGGVAYANELILLDPFNQQQTFTDLQTLAQQLGLIGSLPAPTETTVNSDGSVNAPSPGMDEAAEPAALALLGCGCLGFGAAGYWRRRSAMHAV